MRQDIDDTEIFLEKCLYFNIIRDKLPQECFLSKKAIELCMLYEINMLL